MSHEAGLPPDTSPHRENTDTGKVLSDKNCKVLIRFHYPHRHSPFPNFFSFTNITSECRKCYKKTAPASTGTNKKPGCCSLRSQHPGFLLFYVCFSVSGSVSSTASTIAILFMIPSFRRFLIEPSGYLLCTDCIDKCLWICLSDSLDNFLALGT